jgi:hypothetical protein
MRRSADRGLQLACRSTIGRCAMIATEGQNPIRSPLPALSIDQSLEHAFRLFSPVHQVLTFGRDHGRLVHAILGIRRRAGSICSTDSQERMDQTLMMA